MEEPKQLETQLAEWIREKQRRIERCIAAVKEDSSDLYAWSELLIHLQAFQNACTVKGPVHEKYFTHYWGGLLQHIQGKLREIQL